MLTPAEEQALQAQMLATGRGASVLPVNPVATLPLAAPTAGEIYPSSTFSAPTAPGETTSWSKKIEGDEAKEKRQAADTAQLGAVDATKAAVLGTTEAPPAPPKVEDVPTAAPTGEGLSGGIQQGATLPEQKQINAMALATAQKQFEDRKRAEMAELEKQKQAKVQAWNDQVAAAKAEYTKISSEPTQDNSWTARLLRGLAAGLGAYGAAITHSPNYAQQIMDVQVNRALEEKRDKLKQAEARMEKLGAHPELIDKWSDKQWALTLGKLQADLDRTKTAADVMLARFPQAQLEANKMIAEKQAVVADEIAKRSATVGERTVGGGTNLPASVMQTVQPGSDKLGDKRARSASDIQKFALYNHLADVSDRILKLMKDPKNIPSTEQMDKFANNTASIVAQAKSEEEAGGQVKLVWNRAMRAIDALPSDQFAGMTPEQREVAAGHLMQTHAYGEDLYGQSAMGNPHGHQTFMGPLQYGRGVPLDEGVRRITDTAKYFQDLRAKEEALSGAGEKERKMGGVAAPAAPAGQTPVQKRYTEETAKQIAQDQRGAGQRRGLSADDVAALKWATTHSKDPRAKAIRDQLGAQLRGGE
jgi:hypothetical protein